MSNMRTRRGLADEGDSDFSDLQRKKNSSEVPASEIEEKRMRELAELQSQCNTLSLYFLIISLWLIICIYKYMYKLSDNMFLYLILSNNDI